MNVCKDICVSVYILRECAMEREAQRTNKINIEQKEEKIEREREREREMDRVWVSS